MHVCCKCKKDDTGIEFVGFHSYDGQREICDNCSRLYGCECCLSITNGAWAQYIEDIYHEKCRCCGEEHHIQRCPDIMRELHMPDLAVDFSQLISWALRQVGNSDMVDHVHIDD